MSKRADGLALRSKNIFFILLCCVSQPEDRTATTKEIRKK